LVGRITIDDVVDVIIEDAEEALLAPAGLAVDTDIFAPVRRAARRRAVWLGINLLTALLAAAVISMFEETIIKVVALAVLMPVIASMGGIAGTQTLTLVIRGQATGAAWPQQYATNAQSRIHYCWVEWGSMGSSSGLGGDLFFCRCTTWLGHRCSNDHDDIDCRQLQAACCRAYYGA
jgi:hypothetical protein